MLIGGRGDESQRQRELLKKQIYRQMLDNQILSNQKYRQQQESRHKSHHSPPSQGHGSAAPITHQSHSPPLMGNPDPPSKGVVLPALKDRNTKCEGSSRFVAVSGKEKLQPRLRVRTDPPVDPHSSEEEYFTRCQDIIKELQNINSRAPRHHRRSNRKPYALEQSRLVPRSNHSHSHSLHYQTQSEPRPAPTGSGRVVAGTTVDHVRIPSFIASVSVDKSEQKETPAKGTALTNFVNANSLQQKVKVAKPKENSAQLTHVDQDNQFVFDVPENKKEKVTAQTASLTAQVTTQAKSTPQNKIQRYQESERDDPQPKEIKKGAKPIARPEAGTRSSINRPKSKQSNIEAGQKPVAGTSVELNPKKQQAENIRPEGAQTMGAKSLQREAFLSVLRKLKDRGENLFQKISKNKLEEG